MAIRPIRRNPQTRLNYWQDQKEKPQTYSQKWREYNLAQTNEKLMFMNILRDLCGYIEETKSTCRGRPSKSKQEMMFCMAILTYVGLSSRRCVSELHIARDRGLIDNVPCFNTLLNYFRKPDLKEQLQKLIKISSMPLKEIEKDFAVDSSGFSTSMFGRWFDHRYGKKMKHRLWRKAHVMSGVKSNIITSIEITKGTASDSVMFSDLVNDTGENFKMGEVSADLAYSSRANLETVSRNGAIPFIPFKKHVSGKWRGSMIWGKMFLYFNEHYDEFMERYHKRSNAETVFSMMKRKFGSNLRSKKEIAQDNEILAKALCHNICVLIQETFELGINTEFAEILKNTVYCAKTDPAQKMQV